MSITLISHVRGGGFGSSAWVARITGKDPKFGLAREFVRKQSSLSRSGRSGYICFDLEPGVYEYRGVQHDADHATIGDLDRGFLVVTEANEDFWDCMAFERMPTPQQLIAAGLTAHEVVAMRMAA